MRKSVSLVLCLALIFGVFGTAASAAGNGISGSIKSIAFPEEFQTCKMLCYRIDELNTDTGVYPAYIEFTVNNGSVIKVMNEMNEYGTGAGFAGDLNINGAAYKVAACYTDLKEGEKITFHITVDGADVYCEEAKIVYSYMMLDRFFFLAYWYFTEIIKGGAFDPLSVLTVLNEENDRFAAYSNLIAENNYTYVASFSDLLQFNFGYNIRNIKNIIMGQTLKELFS